MHPSDQKFTESKLPGRKLEIALERLFQNTNGPLSPQWQKTYESYVKMRIYPALQVLVQRHDITCLERLLRTGWAGRDLCLRLLQEESVRDVQIRVMLLTGAPDMAQHDLTDIRAAELQQQNALSSGSTATQTILPSASLSAVPAPLSSVRRLFGLWHLRLGMEHPALRSVLTSMTIQEIPEEQNPETNGAVIFYHRKRLLQILEAGEGYRTYLHMVVHCLFFHILPPHNVDHSLWDLSCDCAAQILAGQMFPDFFPDRCAELRTLLQTDTHFPLTSAAAILHHLKSHPELAGPLAQMTGPDTHRVWYTDNAQYQIAPRQMNRQEHSRQYKPGSGSCRTPETVQIPVSGSPPHSFCHSTSLPCHSSILEQWRDAAHAMQGSTPTQTSHFGLRPGSRQDQMEKREQGQYQFGPYLKRFSVTREEMRTDPDSFDYIPYHYGMELYGNLPFLEPLEYTEASKVEELAIAIDTSGSCTAPMVRRFLGETRKMLTEKEHFFTRMRVHVFQCDSMIQKYDLIHSREEWNQYEETLTIAGRGGTNFTPVFTRIDRMQAEGRIKKLKGLLYFTDGDGVYPDEKPPYETAFIFPDFRFLEYHIPTWIVRLCLQEKGKTP